MSQTRLPGTFLGDESSSSRKRSRRDRDGGDGGEGFANAESEMEVSTSSMLNIIIPNKYFILTPFRLAEAIKRKVYSQHKVRTSTQDRTLDSMFPLASQNTSLDVAMAEAPNTPSNALTRGREVKESECLLTSVKELRKKVQKGKHRRELLTCPLLRVDSRLIFSTQS